MYPYVEFYLKRGRLPSLSHSPKLCLIILGRDISLNHKCGAALDKEVDFY